MEQSQFRLEYINGQTRMKYLNAIYEADKENIKPLIKFART